MPEQEELFGSDGPPLAPGEAIREMLAQKGWAQEELAQIMGVSRVSIANLIAGRSGVSPEMAHLLGAALGKDAAYWMRLDAIYRLSKVRTNLSPVERRARLFDMIPVREMQRRAWISETSTLADLETELSGFFGESLGDEPPEFPVATRKTSNSDLTPAERAWCFRARQMARSFIVGRFLPDQMDRLGAKLRKMATFSKEARNLSNILADFGIRFVIVEPIAGAKIDGAAFWLDENSPVIAVSVRFDRIDAFWFTVLHEWAHIKHGDAGSIDSNLIGDISLLSPTERQEQDEIEKRANAAASAALLDPDELESFIRRVGPLYSKKRIIQFAHTMKIHPGIIVGQLQHRGEIGYGANRDLLVKIRDVVTETALTDGWGHYIAPTAL